MIGGWDVEIPVGRELIQKGVWQSGDCRVQAVEVITRTWPSAVVEDTNGELLMAPKENLPMELFVYESMGAYKSWTENGACSANYNQMIQLIFSEERRMTVVADNPREMPVAKIIKDLRAALGVGVELDALKEQA